MEVPGHEAEEIIEWFDAETYIIAGYGLNYYIGTVTTLRANSCIQG